MMFSNGVVSWCGRVSHWCVSVKCTRMDLTHRHTHTLPMNRAIIICFGDYDIITGFESRPSFGKTGAKRYYVRTMRGKITFLSIRNVSSAFHYMATLVFSLGSSCALRHSRTEHEHANRPANILWHPFSMLRIQFGKNNGSFFILRVIDFYRLHVVFPSCALCLRKCIK